MTEAKATDFKNSIRAALKKGDEQGVLSAIQGLDALALTTDQIRSTRIAAVVRKCTEAPASLAFVKPADALLGKWRKVAEEQRDEQREDPSKKARIESKTESPEIKPVKLPVDPALAALPDVSVCLSVAEDYECQVCKELMFEPATLPCGHTCCRPCLFTWLKMSQNAKCPAGCHSVIARKLPAVNIILRDRIQKMFPKEYEQRRKDCEETVLQANAEDYKKAGEDTEIRPPEDAREQDAIRRFMGSLLAQAQYRLAKVEDYLRENRIQFSRVGPTVVYTLKNAADGRSVKFKMEMGPNGCMIVQALYGHCVPERIPLMTEFVARVNFSLLEGCLELKPDTGSVRFKCVILLEQIADDETGCFIRNAVNVVHKNAFKYLSGIEAMDKGESDPKTAYLACQATEPRFKVVGDSMASLSPSQDSPSSTLETKTFPTASADPAAPAGPEPATWNCTACTLANPMTERLCSACDTPRPANASAPATATTPGAATRSYVCGLCSTAVECTRPTEYARHVQVCAAQMEEKERGGQPANPVHLHTPGNAGEIDTKEAETLIELIQEPAAPPSTLPTCPQKHELTRFETPEQAMTFRCDTCRKGVPAKAACFACRICDWDACPKCYQAMGGDPKRPIPEPSAELVPVLAKAEAALKSAGIIAYHKIVLGESAHIRFWLRGIELRPLLVVHPTALIWYMTAPWDVPEGARALLAEQVAQRTAERIYGNWELNFENHGILRLRLAFGFTNVTHSISTAISSSTALASTATPASRVLPDLKTLLLTFFSVGLQTYRKDVELLQTAAAARCDSLLFAAQCNAKDKVKELLQKCDVNEVSKGGDTALMAAASRGVKEVVELLLEKGADCDLLNDKQDSALSLAVFQGREEVATILAKRSSAATRNRVDSFGNTILMDAAQHGMLALVQLLMQKGAQPELKNQKGQSALSLALAAGHQHVAAVLVEALGPFAAIEAAASAVVASTAEPDELGPPDTHMHHD